MLMEKMRKSFKNRKGFSLVELIVVIAILGVIAGIAVPNVVNALDNSKKNTDKANAAAIANAITVARADGKTVSAATHQAVSTANLSTVIPAYLQGAPSVKFTGTGGALSTDTSFYYTITDDGAVTIFAKTGSEDTDFAQLYPTPISAWDAK